MCGAFKKGVIPLSIYIIGDLHLSFSVDKPMHVFGEHWRDHHIKIKDDWLSKVKQEDTVILAGDTSWGINLDEADADIKWIAELPGRKILLKGNHDYWWTSLKKMQSRYPCFEFLYNNSIEIEGYTFVGTRGWSYADSDAEESDERRIFAREVQRLKNSLASAPKNSKKVCVLHYPPFNMDSKKTDMNRVIEEAGITLCYFAHIHNNFDSIRRGLVDGVMYKMVSADYVNFKLQKIDLP